MKMNIVITLFTHFCATHICTNIYAYNFQLFNRSSQPITVFIFPAGRCYFGRRPKGDVASSYRVLYGVNIQKDGSFNFSTKPLQSIGAIVAFKGKHSTVIEDYQVGLPATTGIFSKQKVAVSEIPNPFGGAPIVRKEVIKAYLIDKGTLGTLISRNGDLHYIDSEPKYGKTGKNAVKKWKIVDKDDGTLDLQND